MPQGNKLSDALIPAARILTASKSRDINKRDEGKIFVGYRPLSKNHIMQEY
jgi:hypothetical protein